MNKEIEETLQDQGVETEYEEPVAQEVEQEEPEQESAPVQTDTQDNMRQLREDREREAERASRAEYERDQLLQQIQNNNQQQQQPQYDNTQDDLHLDDIDFVEGKHLNMVANNIRKQQEQNRVWQMQQEELVAELKLKNEYNDFNDVVTANNIKKLLIDFPELRPSIENNSPIYNRGKAAYTLLKKFGVVPTDRTPHNAQRNMSKPKPTAVNSGPLAHANTYVDSEEEDKALRYEMDKAMAKGY